MTKISATETESEWKKVEKTNEVRVVRCDVCEHDYDEDEWNGREFSVDAGVSREGYNISELSDLFDAYHISVERDIVENENGEVWLDVPKTSFTKALKEELRVRSEQRGRTEKQQLSMEALKNKYEDKLGTTNYYLVNGTIHHFKYVLTVEEDADDHKHVCDDCYDVLFE